MAWEEDEIKMLIEIYPYSTQAEMAEKLNKTIPQIRSKLSRIGIKGKNIKWNNEEILILKNAYLGKEYSEDIKLSFLADTLGRSKQNICRKAREFGLTDIKREMIHPDKRKKQEKKFKTKEEFARSVSVNIKRYILENGHPKGMLGKSHSEESKNILSHKSKERWNMMSEEEKSEHILLAAQGARKKGRPKISRGSWKAGWREVGDKRCFFRSRWEANYARYLEWLKSNKYISEWEHEAKIFWFDGIKRGCVSYLPDFKITNNNGSIEWHEVKGWMDARSKTTIKRMRIYHPNEILIVIMEKQYKEIQNKVSNIIDGWEK